MTLVRKLLPLVLWTYLALLLLLWIGLRELGDRWAPTIFIVYGPRWVYLAPAFLLGPAVLFWRRKLIWVLAIAVLVAVVPIMGFCAHWPQAPRASGARTCRVISANVDGENLNAAAFMQLLSDEQPDVVACQEWPGVDVIGPVLARQGWNVRHERGLWIASMWPIVHTELIPSDENWRELAGIYDLQSPGGIVRVVNLHLETPRKGIEPAMHSRRLGELRQNLVRRRSESERVAGRVRQLSGPLVVLGDFNLPSDSRIFRQYWGDFDDAFESAGLGFGNTKFTRYWGIRIDHALTRQPDRFYKCRTGPDVGSDHIPLIADIELLGSR